PRRRKNLSRLVVKTEDQEETQSVAVTTERLRQPLELPHVVARGSVGSLQLDSDEIILVGPSLMDRDIELDHAAVKALGRLAMLVVVRIRRYALGLERRP